MNKLNTIKNKILNDTKDTLFPVDEDILDMVAILNYLDIPTNSSCQGHPEEKESNFHPWVMICHKSDNIDFEDSDEYYRYAMTNLELHKKLIPLLNEFYKNRETEHQHRIICNTIQCHILELMPQSGHISRFIKNKDDRYYTHAVYKKEFDDFKEFLINKNAIT